MTIASCRSEFYPVTNLKNLCPLFLQILTASLFLACLAQVKIPLFFSPIPLSGQTLGVLLISSLLGKRNGVLSVLCYIVEGGIGLPFFNGGQSGFLHLAGPTGGYMVGFIAQAYFVGWFVEKQSQFLTLKTLGMLLLSCSIQLMCGALWLHHFIGFEKSFYLGILPFIPGEILKAFVVTYYLDTINQKLK